MLSYIIPDTMAVVHRQKFLETLKIASVIIGYWVISISMVFANKYLVGDQTSQVDMSLFVAWMQCQVTVLFVILLRVSKCAYRFTQRKTIGFHLGLNGLKRPEVLMMTVTFVCMLSFNNMCLKSVGVAFFQVARSTTLLFVVLFSVTMLKKPISLKIFLSCLCVAGGFILGVDQEKLSASFSPYGVLFGVITSFFAALNGIFTKKALDVVDHDAVQLTFLCNINASILFLPILTFSGQLQAVLSSGVIEERSLWIFLVCTGVLGFAIAWISALQIDLTSPVTHHISANSKAVLQTLIAVLYYHQHKPALWWGSVVLVVTGAFCYAVTKLREEALAKERTKLPLVMNGTAAQSTAPEEIESKT